MKIDKNKALKKWTPVLENMGVQDAERLDWMSEYAEMHSINENIQTAGVSYANQGNVAGMGNVCVCTTRIYSRCYSYNRTRNRWFW